MLMPNLYRCALAGILALSAGCLVSPDGATNDGARRDDDAVAPGDVLSDETLTPAAGTGTARILFPPPRSLSESVSRTITVRGTAAAVDGVAAVRVNGVAAATSNGFADWQAVVPLVPGQNELVVELEDGLGNRIPDAARASVSLGALLRRPTAMAVDTDRGQVLVAERGLGWLAGLDLVNGARTVLASRDVGTGPMWDEIDSDAEVSAMAVDRLRGRVLVAARGRDPALLFAVDLTTRARTVLSGTDVGTGPDLASPTALLVDQEADRILMADRSLGAVLEVDPLTGDRAVLSGTSVGLGPALIAPFAMVMDAARDRLLVLDAGLGAVLAVDLRTGDRTVLSDAVTGYGPGLYSANAMAPGDAPHLVLVGDYWGTMFEVDLVTGDRRLLYYGAGGTIQLVPDPLAPGRLLSLRRGGVYSVDPYSGPALPDAVPLGTLTMGTGVGLFGTNALVIDRDQDRILALDTYRYALLAIDRSTGDRTVLSHSTIGDGPYPELVYSLALDSANNRVLTLQQEEQYVLAIDLGTGDRTVVSDIDGYPRTMGPMVLDRGRVLMAMSGSRTLTAIDPATGVRQPLVANPLPGAPLLGFPTSAVLEQQRDRVLVVDNGLKALVAFDTVTGAGHILSDAATGTGPALVSMYAVAVDATHDRALVINRYGSELLAVDLATGDRTFLTWSSIGSSAILHPVGQFDAVMVDPDTGCIFLGDTSLGALVVVDLAGSGEQVIVSR